MIKVALKHWVFEACIEQFFINVLKNFPMPRKIIKGLRPVKVGDKFDSITYEWANSQEEYAQRKIDVVMYRGCVVTEVHLGEHNECAFYIEANIYEKLNSKGEVVGSITSNYRTGRWIINTLLNCQFVIDFQRK